MRTRHTIYRILLWGLVASLLLAACQPGEGPADNALVLRWTYSTSIQGWADSAVADFNRQNINTTDGRPIYVQGTAVDAGQAASDMLSGAALPELWTTADPNWRDVLQQEAGSDIYLPNCVSIAESPLVIAMWEPIARALGWPSRTLGWLDVASLAADPSGWSYYSGGEWGATLRLGHAHPGLSDSGVQTLLALVYAAESGPPQITVSDVQDPIVQASVGAFESAVSWFSTDTVSLSDTMLTRGISYLNAAVMYENAVVTQGARDPKMVAIYPFEGTFMATYPTCVRAGMDDVATGAAETFLAYLLDTPQQQRALEPYGLRPVNPDVPLGSPIDAAHGADPTMPTTVFASSEAATVFAIQELWQAQRKDVNLAMVLDVSGSMDGDKIAQVRASAIEFVQQMGDDDRLTVIVFSDLPRILVDTTRLEGNRSSIISQISGIVAAGGTSLFDSIAFTAERLKSTRRAEEVSAMVVLTDGQNTVSNFYPSADERFQAVVAASGASVYTIAYGDDADRTTMRDIALTTNGVFYEGDVSTIDDIYGQISAAFGGSLGIGR